MAHILIIDDSTTEQAGLSQMLQKHGHICSFANTGEIGIATAKKSKPDVILMDVVMPGINGFQATRQITKGADTAHIPVVIVTTKDQETDRVWGKRQGACDYLTKPVDENLLMSVIRNLIPGK